MRNRGVHSGTAEDPETGTSVIRIGWMRKKDHPLPEADKLVEYLRKVGFVVEFVTLDDVNNAGPWDYPLIVIEAGEQLDVSIMDLVVELRVSALSMIIVLLNDATSKQIAHALRTGADAVWSLTEPEQVLYARAKALLRRWLSGSND
jgi:DNA-binding response OmpR family regulator